MEISVVIFREQLSLIFHEKEKNKAKKLACPPLNAAVLQFPYSFSYPHFKQNALALVLPFPPFSHHLGCENKAEVDRGVYPPILFKRTTWTTRANSKIFTSVSPIEEFCFYPPPQSF